MGEIKTNNLQEIRTPAEGGFREIKPELGTKLSDAQGHWKKQFNSFFSDLGGEFKSYEERLKRTPLKNSERGFFEFLRGESKFIPSDSTEAGKKVIEALKEYGLKGIDYKNAEPDFSKCSEATVKIDNMTEHREDYRDSNNNLQPGNFSQADVKCADLWNKQKKDGKADWTDRDVYDYRKTNQLEWHERCDMKIMDLVKHDIHDYFRHSGGVAECKAKNNDSMGGFDE